MHRESGYLAEIMERVALERGLHIVVEGTLKDYEYQQRFFNFVREKHDNYRLAIVYVQSDRAVALERTQTRQTQQVHRAISWSEFDRCAGVVSSSVQRLRLAACVMFLFSKKKKK